MANPADLSRAFREFEAASQPKPNYQDTDFPGMQYDPVTQSYRMVDAGVSSKPATTSTSTMQTYSSPAPTASSASAPPTAAPTTFPSAPPMPEWNHSDEHLRGVADNYAGIQVDPVQAALRRAIEQAQLDADNQAGRIEAAYAGIPAELEKMETRQARADLESAISRGVGQSGAVEWASAHRGEHFASLLAQAEGQKAAELTAIANQLGLTQRQAEERKIELEQLRGMLIQDHLFNLQNQRYDRGMDQWQIGANYAFNVFDRTQLTPMQRWQLFFQGSDMFGNSPGSVPNQWGGW